VCRSTRITRIPGAALVLIITVVRVFSGRYTARPTLHMSRSPLTAAAYVTNDDDDDDDDA